MTEPVYLREKVKLKAKQERKSYVEGLERVPKGFKLSSSSNRSYRNKSKNKTNKKDKADSSKNSKVASYLQPTANVKRKIHANKKINKKKTKHDTVRHAIQIGGTEKHINAGIGVKQVSDNDELHRRIHQQVSVRRKDILKLLFLNFENEFNIL